MHQQILQNYHVESVLYKFCSQGENFVPIEWNDSKDFLEFYITALMASRNMPRHLVDLFENQRSIAQNMELYLYQKSSKMYRSCVQYITACLCVCVPQFS